jgi:hypothetical protein
MGWDRCLVPEQPNHYPSAFKTRISSELLHINFSSETMMGGFSMMTY